jgi:hypothetical protein
MAKADEYPISLTTLLKAIADSLTLPVEASLFSQFSKTIANIDFTISPLAAAARHLVVSAAESDRSLAKLLAELPPQFKLAEQVGSKGWTITMSMTPFDLEALAEMSSGSDADEYMLAYYAHWDSDLHELEVRLLDRTHLRKFQTTLAQSFEAYRREHFSITLPSLIAIFENGLRNLGAPENFFRNRIKSTATTVYQNASTTPYDALLCIWASMYTFFGWLYEDFREHNRHDARIYRHGLQHGTQVAPNSRADALRLFHAIRTMADLHEVVAEDGDANATLACADE